MFALIGVSSQSLGLASLPGGGHTAAHDEAMRTIFDLTQEAGLGFELEPRHVFTSLIDPATLAQLPLGATGLPSIIPDFLGAASMPAAATARMPGRAAPARRGPSLPSRVLLCGREAGLRRRRAVPVRASARRAGRAERF